MVVVRVSKGEVKTRGANLPKKGIIIGNSRGRGGEVIQGERLTTTLLQPEAEQSQDWV